MKKYVCLFLILLIFIANTSAVFAEGSEAEFERTVFFAYDPAEGGLPSGTDVVFGDGGRIYASDGSLTIEASDTYPPMTGLLFPYRVTEANYVFECRIVFRRILSDNCRFSLCFGAQNENMTFEFAIKPGAYLSDSASLLCKSGASSWKTLKTSQTDEYISQNGISDEKFDNGVVIPLTYFNLAVAVRNGTAFGYIDGVKVVECRLNGSSSGMVGFSARGVTVGIDRITLHNELPYSVSAADSFDSDVYRISGGIIEPPILIQRDKQYGIEIDPEKTRPASVMFTVKTADDSLHSYDGAVDLGLLEERISSLGGAAIPTFYVSDEDTALSLSAYMTKRFINDAFVVISKSTLRDCFRDNKYARIILDLSSRDSASADEIYHLLYRNDMRTVLLSQKAADKDTVYELRKRLISVWVSSPSDVSSLYNAAQCGADGIVTADASTAADIFEKISKPLLLRPPIVISDGGDTNAAPAYTKTAIEKALASGIDSVQIHVRQTRDGVLVVYGEDTTASMSEMLTVSESNFSSLRSLTYSDARVNADERIAALSEILELARDEYKSAVLHIVPGDGDDVEPVLDMILDYGMSDRCVIVSSEKSVMDKVNALPEGEAASYSGGPYVWDENDSSLSLSLLCEELTGYNSVYRGSFDGMPREFLSLARLHGLSVYPSDTDGTVQSDAVLLDGYDGFTVKNISKAAKYVRDLSVSVDENGRLNAKLTYNDGTGLDVTALCEIITLEGGVTMNGGIIKGEGVCAVICPQAAQGEKYCLSSGAIRVGEKTVTTTGTQDSYAAEENDTAIIIISIAAGAAVLAGIIMLTAFAVKKRNK